MEKMFILFQMCPAGFIRGSYPVQRLYYKERASSEPRKAGQEVTSRNVRKFYKISK